MKRTLAILIALAMSVMMLTACGSKDGTSGTPDNSGDANQTSTGSYPGNKNITLYCGYSAGGSSDTLCACWPPRSVRSSAQPLPSRTSPALPVGSCGTR